ncbi:MAG: hypothetical protein IGS39_15955 [Calothrix sp. C42_A2020_038]|nr:hypothetical protein [Calothrix sp. C42_A2020_038]
MIHSLRLKNFKALLGWLILSDEDGILAVHPNQRVELLEGTDILPILSNIHLSLTVEQIFSWLNI